MRGFTLLEVLVAIAILAIALAASVRAVSSATDNTAELKLRLLASWVAQNRLAEHIAARSFPSAGDDEGTAEQAAFTFRWQESISETPNPRFRKIEIRVSANDRVLATLIGFLNPEVERE